MALFDSRGIDHVGIRYRDLPRAVASVPQGRLMGSILERLRGVSAIVDVGAFGARDGLLRGRARRRAGRPVSRTHGFGAALVGTVLCALAGVVLFLRPWASVPG